MGVWSMSMTLSMRLSPSRAWNGPGLVLARCSFWDRARYRVSMTREDLPEPETPVTQVRLPRGKDRLHLLEVVQGGPFQDQLALGLAPFLGDGDLVLAGKIPPGQGGLRVQDIL